ncbi:transcription initiation factor TFIID subunit 4 isoform X2 [Oryzias melastigma]|uniref:transcription initiation factor TFIID subunit 4 isoform X2 n=1 Tax=Oryzias melastigma TaxID=30732 RepID=UPI00168D3E54|nr:transcription initiation factor TFIID subunit 4 isoform X2 [Oryzias melastigma]
MNRGDQAPKSDSCGSLGEEDSSVKLQMIQVPIKCGAVAAATPQPAAVDTHQRESFPLSVIPCSQGHQPPPSAGAAPVAQPSPSVMVSAKPTIQVGASHPVPKQTVNQMTPPGRTVVITVPRTAAAQPVAPTAPHNASPKLPPNLQIPAGMMLIRSDSGQLMLVSQQVLAQAQRGPRIVSSQAPRVLTQQVPTVTGAKGNEKVSLIQMTTPSTFQTVQKPALCIAMVPKAAAAPSLRALPQASGDTKKEITRTFSKETLESVKKCKNFLVTLIKLASSDSRSANMANNVRGLVRSLLEGKMEAEEFTELLYEELKSTPQPCLVPFLKKSLPAVRSLTSDPQLFIQQASTSKNTKSSEAELSRQQALRAYDSSSGSTPSRTDVSRRGGLGSTVVLSGSHIPGAFPGKRASQDQSRGVFRASCGSYREDDDINDVASMAGVNLREENARILTSTVGSVVQSCQDQLFLSPQHLLTWILHTVSHATQERLRELMEKISAVAEHRRTSQQEDSWHVRVSDVRSQLRFLEEIEKLKKRRKDEEEKEKLLRLARSRFHTEDPQVQLLRQRARELQQMEEARLQQKEANLTALAAIGPRKKRVLDQSNGVSAAQAGLSEGHPGGSEGSAGLHGAGAGPAPLSHLLQIHAVYGVCVLRTVKLQNPVDGGEVQTSGSGVSVLLADKVVVDLHPLHLLLPAVQSQNRHAEGPEQALHLFAAG